MRTGTKFAIVSLSCLLLFAAALLFLGGRASEADAEKHQICDIDFDDGLGKGHRTFVLVEKSAADQERYRLLKRIWQKNRPAFLPARDDPKIPKIIHQIWLGPKRLPDYFPRFSQMWRQLHPDWEYRLWTDAEVAHFDFDLRDLYEQSTNWGEKSDILRCEILLKFGGLYIDTDFEALKPFDELIAKYDFFAGIEYPHVIRESDRVLHVSDALIGTVPAHPILTRWKEHIRARWHKAERECFNQIEKVLVRTFFTFGDAVEEEIVSEEYCNAIFPSTYFYPLKPASLRNPPDPPHLFKKILYAFEGRRDPSFSTLNPEACAIHHFAATWQKSANELIKEVHQEIVKLRRQQQEQAFEIAHLKSMLEREQQEAHE